MICDHGILRWMCTECRTDADRETADRRLVDEKAALFHANPGRWDAVGVDAFGRRDGDKIIEYAKARYPEIPFFIQSLVAGS